MYAMKNLNLVQLEYLKALCNKHGINVNMPKVGKYGISSHQVLAVTEHVSNPSYRLNTPVLLVSLDNYTGVYKDWYLSNGGSIFSALSKHPSDSEDHTQLTDDTISQAVLDGMKVLTD